MNTLPLVQLKGEPRADTRLLAEGLRNQHKNVLELVERYDEHFRELGVVPFQTEKLTGAKGGRPERYALLNEDQSYLLLTMARTRSTLFR